MEQIKVTNYKTTCPQCAVFFFLQNPNTEPPEWELVWTGNWPQLCCISSLARRDPAFNKLLALLLACCLLVVPQWLRSHKTIFTFLAFRTCIFFCYFYFFFYFFFLLIIFYWFVCTISLFNWFSLFSLSYCILMFLLSLHKFSKNILLLVFTFYSLFRLCISYHSLVIPNPTQQPPPIWIHFATFLRFITVVVNFIFSHTTPSFYPLLSLYCTL